MRTFIALALALLTCHCLAAPEFESNLAELRALKIGAPRKWALVIGASDYQELGKLKYARNDAQEFAQTLVDDLTFKPTDVTILTDEGRPEQAPTAKNILASLDKLTKDPRLDKGDLFIFYFAGHGIGTKNGDYLCPTDATKANVEQVSVPVREVMKRIVATGMRNVLIIADACRAGEKNPFGEELQELGRKTNLAVLLGCAPGKRSYEYADLKHGAFTYFLLKNLKDESLREPTGGLWASNISNALQKQVYEFTEKDFGKYAQQPAGWNEKRQDVMMAQFAPQPYFAKLALKQGLELLKDRGGDAPIIALYAYARFLIESGFPVMAIDYLKSIDSLGKATPRIRFTLADCLLNAGRELEAKKQLDELLLLPKDDYFRLSAITYYPDDRFSAKEKLEAGIRTWRVSHSLADAVFVCYLATFVDSQAASSALRQLSSAYTKDGRPSLFFRAEQLKLAGDRDAAAKLYWQSLEVDGPNDTVHQALLRLIELQQPKPSDDVLLKIDSLGIKMDTESLYFWIGQEARRLKDKGDIAGMMKMAHLGLKGVPLPQEVLEIVKVAGIHAPELAEDLRKHSERNPLSWQLDVAEWIARNAATLSPHFMLDDAVTAHSNDPIQIRLELFSAIQAVLDDRELTGGENLLYNTKFFISVSQFSDKFGLDENLWNRMQRWAENSRRTQQISALARAKLYPGLLAGKGSVDLMTTAMRIAMCAGDDESVEKLWRFAEAHGALRTELAWQYLVYRLLRGDAKRAEALLPKMPKPTFFVGEKAPQVVRAYLDLLAGASPEKIKPLLDGLEPTGFQDEYIWTMAQAMCGQANQAASFFLQRAVADDEYDLYSTGAGLEVGWKEMIRQGRKEEAYSFADIAARYFGNPVVAEIGFSPDPKLSDFVGTITYETRYLQLESEPVSGGGKLTITYSGVGGIEIGFDGLTAKGSVDRFGNVVATGVWQGKAISLRAKLPPPSAYAGHPDKLMDHIEGITADFKQVIFEMEPPQGS